MNKEIFSLLSSIGTKANMIGAKGLNSQYSEIENLYDRGSYAESVRACAALFEQLIGGLYLGVTGEKNKADFILSDLDFWKTVDDREFSDAATMLRYTCYRMMEEPAGAVDPATAAEAAKFGLDNVIRHTVRFLTEHEDLLLDPVVLSRDDVREQIGRMSEKLARQMDDAGCSDGFSMQPPYMNACLVEFPERETAIWAKYFASRLQRTGLLTSAKLCTLDAEWIVEERVGLTNELIRRASAEANGGVLLVEHFEEFDMPVVGGNLLDRAFRTLIAAADMYRGSMCIVCAGQGEKVEKAFRSAERSEECFPLLISLREDKKSAKKKKK